MFCQKCGAANPDNGNVCTNCGSELQNNAQNAQNPQIIIQQPAAPAVVPGKGLGVASMVLGIISLVLFCFWYIAIPCAIIGVALGGVGTMKAKAANSKNGVATAGIACSCVALGIAIVFLILGLAGLASLGAF